MVVQRDNDARDDDETDCRFWLRIPVAERAAATWELSREIFELGERNAGVYDADTGLRMEPGHLNERRLPRAAFSVTRR